MKQKINLRLSLIALIAIIATTVGITFVYYNLFQDRVRSDLATNARLLSESGRFQELYKEASGIPEKIEQSELTSFQFDTIRITWISPNGEVLFDNDTDISGLSNHLDRPEIQTALQRGQGESVRRSDTLHMNTFYYALKLDDGTILRVSTQARSITSVCMTAAPVILIIILLVSVLCIMLGHFLTKQLIRPINTMAEHLDDQMETSVYKELEPFAHKIRSQHEKILDAAAMRQDFTANISHELKTPLTAISGYAELIENHMVSADQETYIAQQIQSNSNRLLSLINDIIKLSELDHTEIPRKLERVNLSNLVETCCSGLQINARQQGIALTCRCEEVSINGDKDLLKELIENLIQNAIRYNKENGWVKVKVYLENGHAVLSVSDNGIGIPKDKQERVFERFYRVDKSRSRETGGTGLGLAIVKHIAEIHHAQIELTSEVGIGTKIEVCF